MRIGVVGPIWQTIPPAGYGGSEVVVYNLVEGLVGLGHDVTLFAAGGSSTSAKLIATVDRPVLEIKGKFDFSDPSYDLLNASISFTASHDFDILHNMVGYQLLPFTPFARCPVVHTSHSSLKEYDALVAHFRDANYVSISDAQRQFHPEANYVATVYHGIDTDKYVPGPSKEDFLVFMGRIMPEKGVHLAIEAAEQSGEKLVIAGIVDERDKEYFATKIKPHLNDRITYVGPADEAMKIDLFQRARAQLFPTQWVEAFGLVMIEAMACGTPSIAWNNGAVTEVIEDGTTGYVVTSVPEMVEAIGKSSHLDPTKCRRQAEQRFSRTVMAEGYEAVYQKLV